MGSTNYLAGLAATANSPRVTPPVVYNNVTLTAASSQPPGICPAGYSCNDVGTDILPGNQVYLSPQQGGGTAGTWTIQAGGSDIWSDYDNFRFISQSFPQDTANSRQRRRDHQRPGRLAGQLGGPWMKTGVMIRSSATDPQAPYYGVFMTPRQRHRGAVALAEAGQTNQVLGSARPTTPIWVMASRYTDTAHGTVYYSAYYLRRRRELDATSPAPPSPSACPARWSRASPPTPTTRPPPRRRRWTTWPRCQARSRRRSSARPPGRARTSAARCRPARTS